MRRKAASLAVFIVLLTVMGCSSGPTLNTQSQQTTGEKATELSAAKPQNWVKTETINPMDGTKTIFITTNAVDDPVESLCIRFIGKQLKVYVTTHEFVSDDRPSVRVKFDEGPPIEQEWSRSQDHSALFARDPVGLTINLQASTKFLMEYKRNQKLEKTISFNIAGLSAVLPESEMAAQKKEYDDLKAWILPHVRPSSRKSKYWCWLDPSTDTFFTGEQGLFYTKEEALIDALAMASTGLAFRKK